MCNPELSSCLVPGCRSAARALAILGIGAAVLAGAAPTEAQNPAPTRFRAEAVRHVDGGDAEVDLTWLHPTGASATGFTVHYQVTRLNRTSPLPGACAATPTNPNPTTNLQTAGSRDRRITIGRLDRESSACFWIRADFAGANASGWTRVDDSPIDLRDETPIGEIPAPTKPGVKPGDARVTVTFGSTGLERCDGASIRWFYTRRLEGEPFGDNPEDTVEVTSLARRPGGEYPVVQNIENGNSYVFKIRVRCQTADGAAISPWSEESEVVTPRGTIDEITEPQGLSVVPVRVEGRDTAALRLTWGHPSSGAPERYRLQYRRSQLNIEDVGSAWTSVTLPGSSLTHDITGLGFNAEYQIRLRGEVQDARPNRTQAEWPCDVGECGPWAEISGTTGDANRPPAAVEDLDALILEVGNTRDVDVAHYFSDPDGDELAFSAFSQNAAVATVTISGSTVTITAVRAGDATVSVSATDPGGLSARAGIEVTVQEAPTPDPPENVSLAAIDTKLVLSWDEPANHSEFTPNPGVNYDVQYRENGESWTAWESPGTTSATRTGDRGSTYHGRVRAVAGDAKSAWVPAGPVTVPDAPTPGPPTNVSLDVDDTSLILSWDEPANERDFRNLEYEVEFRRDGGPWSADNVNIDGTSATLTGSRGSSYRARVRAVAGGQASEWVPAGPITVPEMPVPGVPRNVRLAADGNDLVATWDEPENIDEIPVFSYTVRFRGTGIDDKWRTETLGSTTLQKRIPASYGLERGGTYRIHVRARGAGGDGPWSPQAETTIPELVVPGLPTWLDPTETGGAITLAWEAPRNAAEATVTSYDVALWRVTAGEPASSANTRRRADQLSHTYEPGVIPPGCQYTARVRAIGEDGKGDYTYMPSARLSGPVCEDLVPDPPTDVNADAGDFDEAARARGVSVTWEQDGDIDAQFHQVRFSAGGAGDVQIFRAADQPFIENRPAGRWSVEVRAGVTVDSQSGYSAWSKAVEIDVSEPPPFVVRLQAITILPQRRHGCRPYNGPVEGMAEAYLSPPRALPYTVEATAGSTGAVDVLFSSARDRSLHFTFLPGEVTHPLTTWVDCGVQEGERAHVGITDVTAPTRYAGRVVADRTRYEVEVGNVTPVPTIPTAAAVLLGAILAGLGAIRRRRVARSGSVSSPESRGSGPSGDSLDAHSTTAPALEQPDGDESPAHGRGTVPEC